MWKANRDEASKREDLYDFAKGLAVVWVILFHTYQIMDGALLPLLTIMGTLHNPLFFLIAGVLLKKKLKTTSVREILKKRFIDLIGIFIIWMVIESIIYMCIYNTNFSVYVLIEAGFWAANRLWFFPVLFVSSVIVAFIHYSKLIEMNLVLIGAGWLIIGILVGLFSTFGCKIVLFSFLVWYGSYVENNKYNIIYMSIYLIAVVGVVLNSFIIYTDNTYPGLKCDIYMLIMLLGGVFEYYVVTKLPKHITRNEVICFLGRNSIYYYILSPLALLFCHTGISLGTFVFELILSFVIPTVFVLLFQGSTVDTLLFRPARLV